MLERKRTLCEWCGGLHVLYWHIGEKWCENCIRSQGLKNIVKGTIRAIYAKDKKTAEHKILDFNMKQGIGNMY